MVFHQSVFNVRLSELLQDQKPSAESWKVFHDQVIHYRMIFLSNTSTGFNPEIKKRCWTLPTRYYPKWCDGNPCVKSYSHGC